MLTTHQFSFLNWKKLLPDLIILVIFILASAIYFWPALQGKIIYAGDGINGTSVVQESANYHKETGDYTFWTNSQFSGMPNYQIGGNGGYTIDKIFAPLKRLLHYGPYNAFFVFFFYLCAFFLLLRSFKVDKWLALAGSFAISMSSYFFIIVAAAHGGKTVSITWMTLVLVGFILTYRKQYGWGAIIIMFFTYIGFFLHPQMSYYISMLIGVLFFAELAIAIRDKAWKHFGIATAVFFASFAIGMGMGSANIFTNQEYAEETMRGGHSDLVKASDETNKTGGLDLDYATAWSYGINETMTFLIPNYMGGASGYHLDEKSQLYQDLVQARVPKRQAKQFCSAAPTYWGEKAFTSGPVYMGAIICFLFLLGLIIVPGPYKWALLIATLFSLFLSWGHNFMPLTEFFFKYFPMYNKFRAVESILIVAEITIPLLGILALQEIITNKDRNYLKPIAIAGGITAFICLLVAFFGLGSFTSSYDAQWKGQVGNDIYRMIVDQRQTMAKADAWRSFILIALACVLVYVYALKRFKTEYFALALTALIIIDMWPVDKRFCNDSHFVTNKDFRKAFTMLPYEQYLLDNDPTYYRVLNLTTNTFNDGRTSYYLHSIGGYSAAKLRRYQDLIDEHIAPEMRTLTLNGNRLIADNAPVINMLNTKYAIVPTRDNGAAPVLNPSAMGHAWFVDSIVFVNNANAESDALRTFDLHHIAVIDTTSSANCDLFASGAERELNELGSIDRDNIELTSYTPKTVTYTCHISETPVPTELHSEQGPQPLRLASRQQPLRRQRMAVFSEIYYPHGWKATIDGNPADIFRVNYMLRGIIVPEGDHEIVMTFMPDAVRKGNTLSLICFALFLLTLCGYGACYIVKRRKQ